MKKQKISAKTVALLAMMIALALVFSYVETLIPINFGVPGCEAWPGKPGDCGGTLSDRRQRGISGFCCAYFFEWIYVWKSGFYHVQSGRRSVEPGSDAYF